MTRRFRGWLSLVAMVCATPVLADEKVVGPSADDALTALFASDQVSAKTVTSASDAGGKWPGAGNPMTYLIDEEARRRAQTILDLINVERAKAGCVPLTLNEKLMQAAQRQSQSMAEQDYFYHYTADGIKLKHRVADTGYVYTLLGENIGAGQATPEHVVRLWLESPGHRANILNCAYEDVGMGYVYQASDAPVGTETQPYYYYWTQVFGRHMKLSGR